MSTIERKEYQETKIMRTLSPVRTTYSSNQNLSQFDNNLDYLLEDLQNSVSRPGSSLGQNGTSNTYIRDTSKSINALESNRSNSLTRMVNVKSHNPATEYSSDDAYSYKSPDGRQKISGYKKEKYMYKTTSNGELLPEKTRMQNSLNQLDTLLDDLQQVKNSSFLEKESYVNTGADPALQHTSIKNVNRELHYGDTPRPSSRSHSYERSEREASLKREMQYTNEGSYSDTRSHLSTTPTPSSKTATLTKQSKVTNVHEYPVEVTETVVPDIDAEVLAHLDPNLRPPGNTKVTTTIKTYTYEIPGSGDNEDKYAVYSPNQSISTPSKSFVYNNNTTEINKENVEYQQQVVADYPPYQKPSPPGGVVVKETVTTRNYQPGYRPETSPLGGQTYVYNEMNTTKNLMTQQNGRSQPPPIPRQDTYIVKETTTTNVNNNIEPARPYPRYPPQDDNYPGPHGGRKTYVIKETTNTTVNKNEIPFSERGYPVYNPPNSRSSPSTTYIIKESHHNTTNNQSSEPPYHRHQNGYHPPNEPGKTIIYKHESHTTNNAYGPGGGGPNRPRDVETFDPNHPPTNGQPASYGFKPNEPINIHYSYKSTNTMQNNYKGGYPPNEESQYLLPQKFPTDDSPDGGPPKRLDELMATIGGEPPNSPLNAGFTAHEQEIAQQKKIDTLKRQAATQADDTQKKEPVVKTKNVTGPPVYYPPGQEMFANKEEGEAAWRAQGGYAKASGMYQYEAESKSKSKSSSGATVVPVCLPLCCGLPCALL